MVQTSAPSVVDQATISIVMDNRFDMLMAGTDVAKRYIGPTSI